MRIRRRRTRKTSSLWPWIAWALFSHITAIVSDANIDIKAVEARTLDNHLAHLHMTLAIRRRQDLERLLTRLEQLIDVVAVRTGQQTDLRLTARDLAGALLPYGIGDRF